MWISILWGVWLIVLSKFVPYKSYIHEQQYFLFAFLYLSCSGKLLAVGVCKRPHKDVLLAF